MSAGAGGSSDAPLGEVREGVASGLRAEFRGLPDDLARLAVQRFMRADLRRRSHDRAGFNWQRAATSLSVVAALAASLAAVTYLKSWAAVTLSICVAFFVPLNTALGCAGRAADRKQAATMLDALALKYERYIQLELGPAMWRNEFSNLDVTSPRPHRCDGGAWPISRRLSSDEQRAASAARRLGVAATAPE
jgi:hypothetical protein